MATFPHAIVDKHVHEQILTTRPNLADYSATVAEVDWERVRLLFVTAKSPYACWPRTGAARRQRRSPGADGQRAL